MKYSTFTRYGFLRYSGKPSQHQLVYRSMVSTLDGDPGGSYDMSLGTYMEASTYARAEAVARAIGLLERAQNQSDPALTLEMMPVLERDRRIVPPPGATIQDRRNVLIARSGLNHGATEANVEAQLTALLGPLFLNYHVTAEADSDTWPSTSGGSPGLYSRQDLPTKYLQILDGNLTVGSPAWVTYGNMDPASPVVALTTSDVVVVNAGDMENAEVVSVLATRTDLLGRFQFQANFTRFHGAGFVITTGPFPAQFSTRRFAYIVLQFDAANDPVIRDGVNDLMCRIARGVSQWAIISEEDNVTVGPFVIDTSSIGSEPLGEFTI